MIEPGAVFELPARLAQPPQRSFQENPPEREHRWVLVVSSLNDCSAADCATVQTVLLSAQVEYAGPYDVLILSPDGGVDRDCLAQTDILITIDKRDLSGAHGGRYRGTLMADSLARVRALLRRRLDLP